MRRGDYCSLCWPGATGPADCGLVWLTRDDDPWDEDPGDTAEEPLPGESDEPLDSPLPDR